MLVAAAFCPRRSTRSIAGLVEIMSLKVSTWLPGRRLLRVSSPAALTFSASASAACRRCGEAGLTTKSKAPARMAVTTVSMPPCAVCTITGMSKPRSRMVRSTAFPSMPGMTRSRITADASRPRGCSSTASAASPLSASMAS